MTRCCMAIQGGSAAMRYSCFSQQRSSSLAAGCICWNASTQQRSARGGVASYQCAAAHQAPMAAHVHDKLHVFAMSDLHTDYESNMQWVRQLPAPAQHLSNTLLMVAGDVSDDLNTLRQTLQLLKQKYHHVAFVAGNHELWVKGSDARNGSAQDSVQKLQAVLDVCKELGVITAPARFGALWIVPIISWHHKSWDKEADIPGIPRAGAMTIGDYAACKWPAWLPGADQQGSEQTAEWFDSYNELQNDQGGVWTQLWAERAASSLAASTSTSNSREEGSGVHMSRGGASGSDEPACDILSLSHFLPHQSLLPEKRFLSYPNLAKAVGSDYLWQRLQLLRPLCHTFGHSHFAWSTDIDGMRLVQAPLCYPAERARRGKSIVMDDGGWRAQHWPEGEQQQQQQQQQHQQQLTQQQVAGQQQAPQPGMDQSCPWLPILLYTASYEAVLVNGASSSTTSSSTSTTISSTGSAISSASSGSVGEDGTSPAAAAASSGIDGHSQQQQQQQRQDRLQTTSYSLLTHGGLAVLPSSSTADATTDIAPHYRITSWSSSMCPNLSAMWSAYYEKEARQPDNIQLAPWVLKRYSKFKRRAAAHGFQEAAGGDDQGDRA